MDVSLFRELEVTLHYWQRRQTRYSITWQGAILQFDTDTYNLQRFGTKFCQASTFQSWKATAMQMQQSIGSHARYLRIIHNI